MSGRSHIKVSLTAAAFVAASALPSMATDLRVSLTTEFPAETAAIVQATVALFDQVESSDTPATKTPVISKPQAIEPASLSDTGDPRLAPLTAHGPVQHLTGYNLSWYPVDRMLGAVDFMGTWDRNRNLVCGYITWDLSNPNAPVLVSVVANHLNTADLIRGSDAEVHETLLEANCAQGAIDANFEIFEAG